MKINEQGDNKYIVSLYYRWDLEKNHASIKLIV